MTDRSPGTWLQDAHLRRRLREWPRPRSRDPRFVELGAGDGSTARLLLDAGYRGVGVDLGVDACRANLHANGAARRNGEYAVICGDFFQLELRGPIDLFISRMVLEHLEESLVDEYFRRCRSLLSSVGRIVTSVPAGMAYWGIEDETSGHLRRYERDALSRLAGRHRLQVEDLRGLTFPLSNVLLPVSNYLVRRWESERLALQCRERTRASGYRQVPFKTSFPAYSAPLLSAAALWPFDVLQRIFRSSRRAMVLYCEMTRSA